MMNQMLKIDNKGLFQSITEFEFVNDPVKNRSTLGSGSFGEVKLAKHRITDQFYAIKIMNLRTLNSQSEIDSIEKEIRTHFECRHPHIIQLYDCFIQNNFVYMVMEWARNGNLYSYLYTNKMLKEDEAFKYVYQTCLAIEYLHEKEIIHRDIKPENLLLDENFDIKLCDFGWVSDDFQRQRNTFCGTYEYMAPEIIFKQPYDYRIDIWCIGVLLYELTHGQPPFKGKSFYDVQKQVQKGDVKFSQHITDECKQLLINILQSEPNNRISIKDILDNHNFQELKYQQINQQNQSSQEIQLEEQDVQPTFFVNFFSCTNPNTSILCYRNNKSIKQQVLTEYPHYIHSNSKSNRVGESLKIMNNDEETLQNQQQVVHGIISSQRYERDSKNSFKSIQTVNSIISPKAKLATEPNIKKIPSKMLQSLPEQSKNPNSQTYQQYKNCQQKNKNPLYFTEPLQNLSAIVSPKFQKGFNFPDYKKKNTKTQIFSSNFLYKLQDLDHKNSALNNQKMSQTDQKSIRENFKESTQPKSRVTGSIFSQGEKEYYDYNLSIVQNMMKIQKNEEEFKKLEDEYKKKIFG